MRYHQIDPVYKRDVCVLICLMWYLYFFYFGYCDFIKVQSVFCRGICLLPIGNLAVYTFPQIFILPNVYGWIFYMQYWTESFVQWSPLGTYLATVHRQGAAVWGGASTFNRLMRYAHPQVTLLMLLSFCQRWLVSLRVISVIDCR